jgi:hypothetical protein
MTDPAGIPALIDAIRHLEGVEASHVETTHVREVHAGQVVWEGDIEVFQLAKHPKAKRAYAWSEATTGNKRRFFVVLHAVGIDSPVAALRASILADARGPKN